MSDEAVRERLWRAGVPRDVFSSTLVKAGFGELRSAVVDISAGTLAPALFIHQESVRAYRYSSNLDLAFYLAAKELVLLGKDVFCCTLADVHTALFRDTEEAEEIGGRIEEVKDGFVAIRGFQDVGGAVAPFMNAYESACFATWLIRRQQNGEGILLQAYSPLMECDAWWPMSLLGYLRSRVVSVGVPA